MTWIELVLAVFGSFMASSGFWAYIMKRNESKSAHNRLLMGLAHDRIIYLGMHYLERGYITQDEYENLSQYLYQPYLEVGGNGSAKKIMAEVERLPICSTPPLTKKEKFDAANCP